MMSPSQQPESAFTFLAHGASIQEFNLHGHNIVLAFPDATFYKTHNTPYFGETIGRTTNRVKDAKIYNLNGGKTYTLHVNDGPNSLHGGKEGWGKKDWEGPVPVNRNGREGVLFTYVSRDGEEGYPGTVECKVWYTAGKEDEKTVLDVEYQVEFVGDECEETVVGVTNHSYFNLSPASPTIESHTLTFPPNIHHLPLDKHSIPTGLITPHPSVPLAPSNTPESKQPISINLGPTSPSFDDCFVLDPHELPTKIDTRPLPLRTLITISHPTTNLHLEISSTEPAFQLYTGEGIDVPELVSSSGGSSINNRGGGGGGGGGEEEEEEKKVIQARLGPRSGIAVEPSRYVDAQREEWRVGQCLLKRGQVWGARSRYVVWKE